MPAGLGFMVREFLGALSVRLRDESLDLMAVCSVRSNCA